MAVVDSLKALKEKRNGAGANGGAAGGNSWGTLVGAIALEVDSYDVKEGVVTGRVVNCAAIEEGTVLNVRSMDKYKDKNIENIRKGMGGGKGSVLMLENCYRNEDQVLTRWITTAVSAAKKLDPTTGHNVRSIDRILLQVPELSFKNPSQVEGEPARINWPINEESRTFYTKGAAGKEFSRDWLRDKLKAVVAAGGHVTVTALSPDVDSALRVNSVQSALQEIEGIMSEPGSSVLLRISDGNSSEIRRVFPKNKKVGDEYVNDPDAVIAALKENGLFPSLLEDEQLDEIVGNGWLLEVIPTKDVAFIGDTNKTLVNDVIKLSLAELQNYTSRFGTEHKSVSDCLAVTMPTKAGSPVFVGLPIAMTRDRSELAYIKTKNFDLVAPAKAGAAAAASPEPSHADGGEDFNGDFEMIPLSEADVQHAEAAQAASVNRPSRTF